MGTPEFAVPSLDRLVTSGYRPIAVVTGPDRPRGRGQNVIPTPIKQAAIRNDIRTVVQPDSLKEVNFLNALSRLDPDVIVVVAYRILPPEVFKLARLGAFNLHGSLLPRYRGAAPINRAIMAGERKTGVTTFFLRQEVDTGSIILQREMDIGPDETAGEVHDRMMVLGEDVVVETIRLIEEGRAEARPQDDSLATPAPKIFREDAWVRWDRPALQVHNHIRGLSPTPGAWSRIDGVLLKLYRSRLSEGEGPPGTVLQADDRIVVTCESGAVEIVEIQAEGRRRMPAAEFLKGFSLQAGARFESEASPDR